MTVGRRSRRADPLLARALVGLLTVGVVVLSFPGSAGAQTAPSTSTTPAAPTGSAPMIELLSQDPWTPVGGEVRLGLGVVNAPAGASLSVTVRPDIKTRREFDGAAFGAPEPSVLNHVTVPLDTLPVGEGTGVRTLTLGLGSPTGTADPNRLRNVGTPGVYPLDVDLWDGDRNTVATFRTMLVVDGPTVRQPLGVAWVLPLTAPPSYLPNGELDRAVTSTFGRDGRLGRIALALAGNPDVPVTLAPTGETVEAWAAAAQTDPEIQATFDALQRSVAQRDVLLGPYVPVDLPALLDHSPPNNLAVDEGLAAGDEALAKNLPTATLDRRTRLARPASQATIDRLHVAGADRIVVDADALANPPALQLTLAQPVETAATVFGGGSTPVRALVSDDGLQEILTADFPPAQRVQLLLGGLAMVAREQPSVPRVVTLLSPNEFDPRGTTDFYGALLSGLRGNPFVRPVTVTTAFDEVPSDPPPALAGSGSAPSEWSVATRPTSAPTVSTAKYQLHRERIKEFAELTDEDDPAITVAERALWASVATGWSADVGRPLALRHLRRVDAVIDDLVSLIEVPDPRTITLTSKSGEIPLTFRNKTGSEIQIRAVLTSDKLFFPDGPVVNVTLPSESTTVRVKVEARTSGTFPLHLEVTSANGVLAISQRRLEVRSTFVSTVGVALMVSAAAFLALWWGWDLRRRHRRRRSDAVA